MKTLHTAGPWTFLELGETESAGNACWPLTITSPSGDDLANIWSIDDTMVSISREEAIANAMLISAAPDLLAALQHSIMLADRNRDAVLARGQSVERPPEMQAVYDQCVAAVAKATGVKPQ